MDSFDLRLWPEFVSAGGDSSFPAIIDQVVIDSRRIDSANALFIPLKGRFHDGHSFIPQAIQNGARYILAEKAWIIPHGLSDLIVLRVDSPLRALQQIAGSYRQQLNCKVIAVTGSYGKTMVKDLLYAMLSPSYSVVASPESFNSQIGVPLSLLTIRAEHEIAIIEVAISEKDEMDPLREIVDPDYGIITHIGKRHLVTLFDLDTVAVEILKLFSLKRNKWVVLPNDQHLKPLLNPSLFSSKHSYYFWNEINSDLPHAHFVSNDSSSVMSYCLTFPETSEKKKYQGEITSGFYYFLDLLNITSKAAWLLGAAADAISNALGAYAPIPMRTEIWKSAIGTTFINDTYSSDPQSVDASLSYLEQSLPNIRKVFAFGGIRGNHEHLDNDYKRIGQSICRSKVDLLFLYGNHSFDALIKEIREQSSKIEICQIDSFSHLINLMQERVQYNDAVLIKGDQKHPVDKLLEAFNDSISSNQYIINLAAIAQNLITIRKRLPPSTRVMVMVKALAYGTDEVRIAKFLETCDVDILGVSYVDEGVILKRAGVSQSIFVINAVIYEVVKVVKWDLEIGVSDQALIEAVANEASLHDKKIKVHLHVDTGMGRFGCRPEEALSLAKLIKTYSSLELEGVMTHFASSDNPKDDDFTISQANALDKIIRELAEQGIKPRWTHACNSSGAMRFYFPQFNMVRIGLAVYGLYASHTTKESMELRLAISLISRVVGINVCKKGESISYGRTYTIERDQQHIAVLPIGYFDGLHRNYSGKGSVIIRGKRAPMVGNICMDFMMIDITNIPNVSVGDPVLMFGEDEYGHYLSPEDLATQGDSIIHELITCLGPRIQRIFVHEEASVSNARAIKKGMVQM